MFIKKYLKWISTALVLTGILLTNLNAFTGVTAKLSPRVSRIGPGGPRVGKCLYASAASIFGCNHRHWPDRGRLLIVSKEEGSVRRHRQSLLCEIRSLAERRRALSCRQDL